MWGWYLFGFCVLWAFLALYNTFRRKSDYELWGALNPALVCPHCQTKGEVRTKSLQRKAGISGGKATAALLTAGLSVVATGLSRKENVTQAHCMHCNSTWTF
jgi:hypothetical protein